ncbi:glycosyltransferase [Lysinibacillus telephonicus]|uniref:Glycosyltransferase n=1 Tax=Lysinibacillus telephonicus TaxID=1714840 RepID=A0A3S0HLB7_9BACI|nr:glycosyltransferase [Lysinibacillus telephonicus]RTQ93160.1 glycosyltransferase [Lysinibacillus telephonicus]
MKPKVLLAQNSAFIANRLPRAARALKQAGYDVEILNWDRGINSEVIQTASSQFAQEGIKVHSIYCGETPYGKGILTAFQKGKFIYKVVKFLLKNGHNYQVVHAIDFDLAYPTYLAKKIKRKLTFKFIYDIADFVETFHSPIPKPIRRQISKLSANIMEHADLIIIPDENRLINIPSTFYSKIQVISNTIDPPKKVREYPIDKSEKKINILYYGALSKDRGIKLLLQLARLENVAIWIAGKGELQEEIVQHAEKSENIHFLGYLEFDQILSVVQQVHLIYMVYDPSYQHNQIASPNKLFEALYLGKPCIVTEGTSIDQFVEKNNIGYVVTFDVAHLVDTIKSITIDELELKGENAKLLYPHYSWDKTRKTLLNIYYSITNNGDTI